MNEHDRAELEKRLRPGVQETRWGTLDAANEALPRRCYSRADPTPESIKKGKPPKVIVAKTQEVPFEVTKAKATALIREARLLANDLAAFFPARRRWHWIDVFTAMALEGTGTVEQRQCGGRPKGRSPDTDKGLLEMAQDYWDTCDYYRMHELPCPTQPESVESRKEKYKHISVSTLQRALILWKKRESLRKRQ